MTQHHVIALIILYFVIVLAIGWWSRKKETNEGFLLANRNLGVFALTGTLLASMFGGTAIIVTMSFVYDYGAAIIWAFLSTTIGCFLLAALVPKIKKLADKKKHHTYSDYFFEKYGKQAGTLVASIILLVYFGYLLVQLIAGSIILSTLTTLTYTAAVVLVGGTIILYVYTAGFRAVVKTDVFQYLIILLLFILSIDIFRNAQTIPTQELNLLAAGGINTIGFLIYGIMILFVGAEFWQRIYAAKNNSVARKSLIITGTLFFLLGILVVLIGLSVKASFPDIIPTTALIVGFEQLLSGYLLGIGLVLLFAAVMSSADTFLFVLSTSVSKDFLARKNKQALTKHTQHFTIAIGILAIIVAILFDNIVEVVTSIVGISFALFPATIFSFWYKLHPKAVNISIILGIAGAILAFITIGISVEAALVSLPIALITLGIMQSIHKN
ncbi:MAG: sodium:solute symporter family protein [Candidatus Woesearchaeota archaeon]